MHEEKLRHTNIKIILILTFAVLAVLLFFTLDSRKNKNQQQHLQLVTERYQLAYNTIYDQYRQFAANIQSGMIERFAVKALYQELLTADEKQKERLRKELLAKIQPRFNKLQQEGMVRHFHFHLQDNESFLLLQQPDTLSGSYTENGKTVAYVNREHSPISGFEGGGTFNSYRFFIPITTL